MRPVAMIVCFLMIASCYAFKISSMEEFYPMDQNRITEESLKLQESLDSRLPVTSNNTTGFVSRHTVAFEGFSSPIFIIGDDAVSKRWLNDHAKKLREIRALGFITNIKDPATLQELQHAHDLPLLPANVDDLMVLLDAKHYPLIMNKGVVWQ